MKNLAIWNSERKRKQTITSTPVIGWANAEKVEAIASGKQTVRSTKATGKETNLKAKEEWSTLKEPTTLVYSLRENKMETELATSLTNQFIKEIMLTIRNMEMGSTLCQMGKNIRDNIKMERKMDKVYSNGLMVKSTRASGLPARKTVMESMIGLMVRNIKVTGKTMSKRALVNLCTQMVRNTLENTKLEKSMELALSYSKTERDKLENGKTA